MNKSFADMEFIMTVPGVILGVLVTLLAFDIIPARLLVEDETLWKKLQPWLKIGGIVMILCNLLSLLMNFAGW